MMNFLHTLQRRGGQLKEDEAVLVVMRPLLTALQYIHAQVKPFSLALFPSTTYLSLYPSLSLSLSLFLSLSLSLSLSFSLFLSLADYSSFLSTASLSLVDYSM